MFLRRISGAALLAAVSLMSAFAEQATLTILHTNDIHSRLLPLENGQGGFARLAAVLRREREGCKDCIVLNAGDLAQGSPVSTIFKGLPVWEIANQFGFDAATLGNHDFDYGWQQARKFVETAKYPVVLANMVDDKGAPLVEKPWVILNVNGLKVGVLGLLTDEMKNLSTPKLMGPWHTTPVIEAARKYVAELRKQVDLVVVLGHLDTPEEAVILHTVNGVGVVVTGHAHNGMQWPLSEGNRVMVRAKSYGAEVGRLELVVDKEKKALVSWKWRTIPVDANAPAAEDVAAEVRRWEAEVTKVVDQPIGESKREMKKAEVKLLIEKAMIAATGADFAFMNPGGVRDIIPQGKLLARNVWNIMPFDNKVVTGRFKGSVLPAAVKEGHTVDPDKDYTLAVSDFTAANQSSATELNSKGLEFGVDGPLLRDVILDYVKKAGVIE